MSKGDWKSYLGLAIGVLAFVGSIANYFFRSAEVVELGERHVLYFSHWQLEDGCREGFGEIIEKYEALHPDVKIVQNTIPDSGYKQWLVTQVLGNTVPDIVEKSWVITPYQMEAFVPLTEYLEKPNPYCKGTRLEGIPWRECFYGGLSNSFDLDTQEYWTINYSMFVMRMFYNKNYFARVRKEFMGEDGDWEHLARAPETWGEFFEVCENLRKIETRGKAVMPIAVFNGISQNGQTVSYLRSFSSMFLPSETDKYDRDMSGMATGRDVIWEVLLGDLNLDNAQLMAPVRFMRRFRREWADGFNGITRESAQFLFTQGWTAMYFQGSWEARSVLEGVGDKFEVGVMQLPSMKSGFPYFGGLYDGLISEVDTKPCIPLMVSMRCREKGNLDVAIDFLQFMTSPENSKRFAELSLWTPGVRYVYPEGLEDFMPNDKGGRQVWPFRVDNEWDEMFPILQEYLAPPEGTQEEEAKLFRHFLDRYSGELKEHYRSYFIPKWRKDSYRAALAVRRKQTLSRVRAHLARRRGDGSAARHEMKWVQSNWYSTRRIGQIAWIEHWLTNHPEILRESK